MRWRVIEAKREDIHRFFFRQIVGAYQPLADRVYHNSPGSSYNSYLPNPTLPVPTMSFVSSPADAVSIDTIRTLAADVVGKANSGHPGLFR